jgi:hypothetical protein
MQRHTEVRISDAKRLLVYCGLGEDENEEEQRTRRYAFGNNEK